jgi:hypothetical protein
MSSSLLSLVAAAIFATQAALAQPTLPQKNTTTVMTLTGCINRDTATPGSGTRLSGFDGRKDAWHRGEMVVGTGSQRIIIRGGLVPSPNVAAQAGALDPSKVAVASRAGGTHDAMRSDPLPEFRTGRVQAISGPCP